MKTMKLFFRYIKKYLPLFIITVVLLVVLNYIRSFIPKLTGTFVSIVEGKAIEDTETPSFLIPLYKDATTIQAKLAITALSIACMALVRESINIVVDINTFKLSESIGCKAQIDFFNKIQNLPYSYLNRAETGDLIQRSTQDVSRFKAFIEGSFLDLFNSICKLVVYGACMFAINVEFTLLIMTFIPVYFISSYFYFKKQSDDWDKLEQKDGAMNNVLQENLTGIRIVKSFANEAYEIQKFNNAVDEHASIWKRTTRRMAFFWGISDDITFSHLLLVFILSIIFIAQGKMSFDIATIMFLYTEQIIWPCRNLGRTLADFGKTSVCCGRILEVLDKKDEYNNTQNEKPEIEGNITFKNVSFKFDDASIPTLNNINLDIKAGETIAIVGKTGCGKSTFVNMLNRLLDPTEGEILLDGNDITKMDKKYVREKVGLILQEPFLYSRSIGENINIALPYDDAKRSKELAKIASVDKDIEEFEEKYKTIIGERGVTLSGGQKQRIAIARMLSKKHSIIIFDDSLSAVDTETDLKIRQALKVNQGKATTLIITHRVVTAKDADRIIVFENGSIANVGTHNELIKVPGLYQTIYKIQNYFNESPSEGGDI